MRKITVPFFISHHGCPHTCSFCDQKTISGTVGNLPTDSELLHKIDDWHASAAGRSLEVAFFGGTFTALPRSDQERLLHPLQELREAGVISSIRISTRPDYLDREIVLWLKQHGVKTIEIGVQSMDDAVLQRAGRGHTAGEVLNALACVKEQGVVAGAQLMPGLPGDTMAQSRRSLRQVVEGGADFLRIYPVVVLEGTELARQFRVGDYKPLSLEEGVNWCKVLLHDAMLAEKPVIRIGLQADEGLNRRTVVAGCWHPALGQLVSSALYADLIHTLLEQMESTEPFRIYCHPSRLSDCIGHNREHIQLYGSRLLGVTADDSVEKSFIRIENSSQIKTGNIITEFSYANL